LDIGCGTGDFVALSLGLGASKVDGVDVSSQVISKAVSRFATDDRVRLRQGTVIEQVTEQGRYDLITSITVLQHHVEEAELIQALGVLRDALKPEGRMIVLELAPPHKQEVRQYSRDLLYLVERSPQAWRAAFAAAGLRVVSEPVMPQFGIACLRGVNSVLGLVHKPSTNTIKGKHPIESTADTAAQPLEQPLSLKRRILRAGLQLVRRLTLLACKPIDHWLRLPLPPAKYRTYRVFVLSRVDS
jgi:SAM-dependent methyltransferase